MITEVIEWVPVEERMPDKTRGKHYLVRAGGGFAIAHVFLGAFFESHDEPLDGRHGGAKATHWAEIKGPSAAEPDPSVIRLTSSLGMLVVHMAWAERMPAGEERDEIIRMYRGRMATLCEALEGLL